MAKSTQQTQITAIEKTINHPEYFIPMSYHKLTRVEHSLITNETSVTFASYFNKASYEAGAKQLDYTSVILPIAVSDFTEVVTAVINDGSNNLGNGEAV